MNLLTSESLPTAVLPDRVISWLDNLDDYVSIVTCGDDGSDDREPRSSARRPRWSELLLSTRWSVFVDLI